VHHGSPLAPAYPRFRSLLMVWQRVAEQLFTAGE
jgi:hypothetical protein